MCVVTCKISQMAIEEMEACVEYEITNYSFSNRTIEHVCTSMACTMNCKQMKERQLNSK